MKSEFVDEVAEKSPELVIRLEILGEVVQDPMAQRDESSDTYHASGFVSLRYGPA